MFNELKSSSTGLIPPQPMPVGAQDFSKRMTGLLDGRSKDEVQVNQALEGMDAMLDAIAAGMYTPGLDAGGRRRRRRAAGGDGDGDG